MSEPWVNIGWRIAGSLRPLFRVLGDEAKGRILTTVGGLVKRDVQAAARGKGWPRLGPAIAQATSYQMHGVSGVEVGTAHPVARIRQMGGPIAAPGKGPGAKPAQYLTIPVAEAAKGHSAGEMRHLGWMTYVVKSRSGRSQAVIMGIRTRRGRVGARAAEPVPLFVLKKQVRHPADPWFPREETVFRRINQAVAFATGVRW